MRQCGACPILKQDIRDLERKIIRMNAERELARELLMRINTDYLDKDPLDLVEGYMRLAQIQLLKEMFDGPNSARSTQKD